jgi:hypothetical protein
MSEDIVLLSSTDQAAKIAVEQHFHVASSLPPRLLVVSAEENVARALRDIPGVLAVIGWKTSTLPDLLNETERLFVRAWQQRQQSNEKDRHGDGMNWGADDFSPPDRPDPAPR